MKKNCLLIVLLGIFTLNPVFAQNSANAANRNTALRCLKLAENYLTRGDFQSALKQAELGLSYDDSVSDLIYVKAAALSSASKSKAEVLAVISEAFKKNNWLGYSKNGARLLYADLLSDTGDYDLSLQYLNSEPFIYSADAEFVRIKNYYRMGSEEALEEARLKVNSARRIYPSDVRFPKIFFMFEQLYLSLDSIFNREAAIQTNTLVQTIAESYIAKLPDYSDKDFELEILAAFFAEGEAQQRLVKALFAKTKKTHPLLAILGLKTAYFDAQQAFDYFINASKGEISLISFEYFMQNLQSEEIFNSISEYFTNFEGTFYVDVNYDLQNEMLVTYEVGRPKYITYDINNDGESELFCECDFGLPKSVYLLNNTVQFLYDTYPAVSKVYYPESKETINYLYSDYLYYPFEMAKEPFLQIIGLDFYMPVALSFAYPEFNDLDKAGSLEVPGTERENCRIVYTLNQGIPVSANFYENDRQYAYCDFQTGFPIVRYADYDNDDIFETSEVFDLYEPGKNFGEEDFLLIKNIFRIFPEDYRIYLRKISIDRNMNTFAEYSEEFLENEGRISTWDNDDNGIPDYQFIKYPVTDENNVKEETLFYNEKGDEKIRLTSVNSLPYSLKENQKEILIFAGLNNNIYWLEEKGPADLETQLLPYLEKLSVQGSMELYEILLTRVSVIKIGDLFFCKIQPDTLKDE